MMNCHQVFTGYMHPEPVSKGGVVDNYFTDAEMKCKCCGKIEMDPEFMGRLNTARAYADFPFSITSGYRCERHNRDVKSTSNNHVVGKAADILCQGSVKRFDMIDAMMRAGMLGIGCGMGFIHCDINRKERMFWTY